MTERQLYFAYGSNLDPEQMADRCPGAPADRVARLDGWSFRIANRGYATIVAEPAATVWGGLWWLTPEHEATLDDAEGVDRGYYRRELLDVTTIDGEVLTALVYIEPHAHDAPPNEGYLERILRGAEWFRLPGDYRDELAWWGR